MFVSIIIFLVSLIFDGILSNFLPYTVGNLSYFTPLFTLMSIFIVYPYFYKNNRKYYIFSFVGGMIYDLFYTNLMFFNGILFLMISFIVIRVTKNMQINFFNVLYQSILVIIIYEVVGSIILVIFNMVPITFSRVLYKISHSIILNICYVEVIYLIIKNVTRDKLSKSIN